MSGRFESAYAKLDRADDHLAELHGLLFAYMSQPDVVTGTLAGATATGNVRMKGMGHKVQVVIGDLAHNLRSALDHVTWQLVLANGGVPKSRHRGHAVSDCDGSQEGRVCPSTAGWSQ